MPLYDCGDPDCGECQQAFGPDRSKAIAATYARERAYAAIPQPAPTHLCPKCMRTMVADRDENVNCCYPDCGCDGARLCMAESGPNVGSMSMNFERRSR